MQCMFRDKPVYFCPECAQYFCNDCNTRIHKHPKRSNHTPNEIADTSSVSMTYSTDDEYNMEISPSLESSFVDAELIATLAEKFKLTSFKPFQKIIEAALDGQDTLVLYQTGSGIRVSVTNFHQYT